MMGLALGYPTSDPSGLAHMDVNGLAGSLEIYFGEDVLRRTDGTFTPVHWRGFDAAVRERSRVVERGSVSRSTSEFFKTPQFNSNALWLAKRLRVTDPRSVPK